MGLAVSKLPNCSTMRAIAAISGGFFGIATCVPFSHFCTMAHST